MNPVMVYAVLYLFGLVLSAVAALLPRRKAQLALSLEGLSLLGLALCGFSLFLLLTS